MFVKETNDLIAIWEGEKLSKKEVEKMSGINQVKWSQKFEKIAKEVEKEIIRRWNCKVERTKIDFLDMKDVQEAILKIKSYCTSIIFLVFMNLLFLIV